MGKGTEKGEHIPGDGRGAEQGVITAVRQLLKPLLKLQHKSVVLDCQQVFHQQVLQIQQQHDIADTIGSTESAASSAGADQCLQRSNFTREEGSPFHRASHTALVTIFMYITLYLTTKSYLPSSSKGSHCATGKC